MRDKGLSWEGIGNFFLRFLGLGLQHDINIRKVSAGRDVGLVEAEKVNLFLEERSKLAQNAPDKGVDLMKIGMILGGFLFLVVILVLFKGGGNNAPQPVAYVPQVAGVQQGMVR